MTAIDTGGPANPETLSCIPGTNNTTHVPYIDVNEYRERSHPGMTLLDYVAAQTLAAIVTRVTLNPCGDFVAADGLLQHYKAPEYAAKIAYQFAMAMIDEKRRLEAIK